MNKHFSLLITILFIPMILANNLTIELNPHYYLNGREVKIYIDNQQFNGISFDVIGINNFPYNISNISVYNSTFTESLSVIDKLEAKETKTLWNTKITDLSNFTIFDFIIGVKGELGNVRLPVYGGDSMEIIVPEVSKDYFYILGKVIYHKRPYLGVLLLFILITLILLYAWNKKNRIYKYGYIIKNKVKKLL